MCTSIAELDAGTLRRWRGNYSSYREQKERETLTALREFEKQQDFVAKEMDYIRRNMAGRISAQAKGRPTDRRTDVWAFGCVLYEMLSGRRAFDGEDATEIISAVMKSEPEWNALPREVPATCEPSSRAVW